MREHSLPMENTCGRELWKPAGGSFWVGASSPSWEFTLALWEAELGEACLALVEPHLTGSCLALLRCVETPPPEFLIRASRHLAEFLSLACGRP